MATLIPPSPPEGLKPESLLVGWFGEKSQAVSFPLYCEIVTVSDYTTNSSEVKSIRLSVIIFV